jgi:multiple sugar transport system permease protein
MPERIQKGKTGKSILLFSPTVVLMALFFAGPVLIAVYYSMTNKVLTGSAAAATKFVGFKNFADFFRDPKFGAAFNNTMLFLIFSGIVGQQVLGFLVAYLMQMKHRNFRRIVGFVVLVGWITPEIVAAFMFSVVFAEKGVLNQILAVFGASPVAWLFTFPMASVIVANIWKGTAYPMMMFQAALDNVPAEVVESVRIDGANGWQVLAHITLPMIKSTMATVFILVTLGTLNAFGLIYALTGGGPGAKTTTLSMLMYQRAFISYQVGYGMAIALALLLFGIALSLLYIRVINAEKDG